ncbi:hypothetical protein Hokovirus_1_57 [Hokovirus HKV1]|uniref:Uncharacterized protein n=1 Tax=Hokovirus HKV1 TaxID=1977638 RepID=A0A1V0SEW5_9VIRU|nr:hypothetical protein Hokovirus_1_57 [Hokovirus HKV1]
MSYYYELINNNKKSIMIGLSNMDELTNFLKDKDINIRLDLHGVLDTIDENIKFDNYNNICCVSFVGFNSNIRNIARDTIINRIGKQIHFGILVFKRGKNYYRNNFTVIGSKAHVNSIIPLHKKGIFIDDSIDHYESTKSLNISNLDTWLFKKNDNLQKILEKY